MALVTMYVINAYQRKGDPVYSHSFHSRRAFSSCTLVIKWSTSVIRGTGLYVTKCLKVAIGSSFTIKVRLETSMYCF